jgi:hypothetical protein
MMTRVENKRTYKGKGVYIGRPSRWGNPFMLGGDGDRDTVIELYRQHLWEAIKAGRVSLEDLAALDGQTLICWCAPQACHGDVLARAAAWARKELECETG